MTPSSQPVRATSKSSVKRNQNYDSYSSQSNNKPNGKRQQQQTYQVQNTMMTGKSQNNRGRGQQQSKGLQMSFSNVSGVKAGGASNWSVYKTPEGVEYYYNQRTRATTYEKPDELKSEAERALKPCPWKEFKTADGRLYWNNSVTQVSVWEEPEELKQYKAKLSDLQAQLPDATASFTQQPVGNSPFIATIQAPVTRTSPVRAAPVASPEPAPEVPAAKPAAQVKTWKTEAEARAAFELLLRETVTRPSMSWKEVVPLLTKDIRYTAIGTSGQRKQIFSEFVSRMAREVQEAKQRKLVEDEQKFREMLKQCAQIKRGLGFSDVQKLLREDERWKALESARREQVVYAYLKELEAAEKESERQAYKQEVEGFKKTLQGMELTEKSRWADMQEEVKKRYTGKLISEKSQRDLFYDYIDRMHMENEKKRREQEAEVKKLTIEILEQLLLQDKMDSRVRDAEVKSLVLKDERMKGKMVEEEAVMKWVKDFRDRAEEEMHNAMKDITELVRENRLPITATLTPEEFSKLLEKVGSDEKTKKRVDAWKDLLNKRKAVAAVALKRALSRIVKEDEKKATPQEKRDFKHLLSEYLYYPEHLEYQYEEVKPQLQSKHRWQAVKTEEERKAWYKEYMGELKEKLDKKKREGSHHHHHHHSSSRR
ncbi:hypothetical protein BLSTO_04025 [Blastocystis sp. subtype 1]